jgi:hypothetical protein
MKKRSIEEKPHLKKKHGSRPGHGSIEFCRVIASAGLLTNLD